MYTREIEGLSGLITIEFPEFGLHLDIDELKSNIDQDES